MRVFLILSFVALARGYPYFQDRIPNGPNVQHPCKSHLTWAGVGHFNAPGGGKRNPFGLVSFRYSFIKNIFHWSDTFWQVIPFEHTVDPLP